MTRGTAQTVAVVALAIIAAGCASGSATTHAKSVTTSASPSPSPTTLTLQPIAEIRHGPSYAPNYTATPNGCRGANGFDDLRKGAAVTLYKANGDVVGTGFVKQDFVLGGKCYLVAKVSDVDPEAYFQVQFGNRNKLAFSRKELEGKTAVSTFG